MARKELILGAGNNRAKQVFPGEHIGWSNPVRLDIDPNCKPDVEWDLNRVSLPMFGDDEFDEIHAYHVLEHLGTQGDEKFFFAQFTEFWRILKPEGHFMGIVPTLDSIWAWGDPGHKRVFHPALLTFLDQEEYTKQVGRTAFADYRYLYKADFIPRTMHTENEQFFFLMEAVKPSRISV